MFRINVQSSIRVLSRLNNIIENVTFRRNLYAPATLGLNGYSDMRERTNGQFINTVDKFKEKMKTFVDDKPTNMIFTEDLRNMIHLAEKNKEDIELVVKMIKKFNSQNKELRFGNFVFGPVVFRMFYYLGDVDTALECFKDPQLDGFFDQLISYQLLMDLLFEKGRYQDILNVFDLIKSRQVQGTKYARHIVVLTMAACYKLNTPQSLEFALNLLRELRELNYVPMRKAAAFAAGLALRQNSPHVALEIVANQKDQQYITMRNIKALAYAEMNRPEDALPILRSVLEVDEPVGKGKRTFIRDVVNKVGESIKKNNRKDLEADFVRIEKFLADQGHISDDSLDTVLCLPITDTSYTAQRREKSMIAASFNRDSQQRSRFTKQKQIRNREGLADLY
ncbi:unnamed protein product [Hermetia illucens]|uniref:Pentatricopeptide repeat-containing protein 2, mitochondrial n=1 Tax=Hermetia illucens TaxID=343691 RepID=A0A7R8YM52_HERIL|nr:pentatricopeptide repeat-containing protein 2, mitochondrial-like [Hermetia illucens]CAD7077112.1 unnamed protein product [Hermetia illucens]